MDNYPIARELVLVGGGHSHVIFLRMLGMQPVPGLKVTLISPDPATPYSGMLPGLVAGHYTRDEVFIDLGPLCRFAGADFIMGAVTGIDTERQCVSVDARPAISYDVLSLDIGCTPSVVELEKNQGVLPVKPISSFLIRFDEFLKRLEAQEVTSIGFAGAGAGGVELCLAVHHALTNSAEPKYAAALQFHLFTDSKTVLKDFDASVRVRFERLLTQNKIQVHREFRAASYTAGELMSGDGRSQALDEVFWVTQAGAQSWPLSAGLGCDERGFIEVRDTLQSVTHPNIFAVGDCATMIHHRRPKAGVYAVRQGAPLFNNIRAYVLGESLKDFKPQSKFLSLISTGPQRAIASRNGLSVEGDWVWRWKNAIDQRFMKRFTDLPAMVIQPVNNLQAEFDDQMHCGGCGSKVSSDILSDVLAELMGAAAPTDDAAAFNIPEGRMLLQSVDHFRSILNDPYLQARVAVCHALSDIYACGGQPHSAMAMFTLPFGKPGATRSLLRQLLSGTLDQFLADSVELLGGHTSEGLELSTGYTVNGLVTPGEQWTKQGLTVGDRLVLTKPLGTGTLFAADMQFKAKGEWIAEATHMMLQSNGPAVGVLRQFSVSACTDITGFGLAGHTLEMLLPGQGVRIQQADLPTLAGADECLYQLNISSSLHDSNRAAAELSIDHGSIRSDILFDPQTSGGLLVGLPDEEAQACVTQLRLAGFQQAAVIGTVIDSDQPRIELI